MPCRPAPRITAKARYGLQALSSVRISTRRVDDLPGEYIGTRTSADRFACPQQMFVGASPPTISRLYEFAHWFVTAVISLACRSTPATNALPVSESS